MSDMNSAQIDQESLPATALRRFFYEFTLKTSQVRTLNYGLYIVLEMNLFIGHYVTITLDSVGRIISALYHPYVF